MSTATLAAAPETGLGARTGVSPVGRRSRWAAAMLRHGEVRPEHVRQCARSTPHGVRLVTAPAARKGAAASAAAVASELPKLATDLDLVVDAGRVASLSDRGLLAAADRVLLLVAPTAPQLARLAEELPGVRELCGGRLTVATCDVGWSGPLVHRVSEVAAHLECEVRALPYDPRTAGVVAGRPGSLPPAGQRLGWWQRWRFPLLEAVRNL